MSCGEPGRGGDENDNGATPGQLSDEELAAVVVDEITLNRIAALPPADRENALRDRLTAGSP